MAKAAFDKIAGGLSEALEIAKRDAAPREASMASETHRWNVERDGSDLLICEGDHERHEGCAYVRYVPATTHQRTLEALREAEKALRLAEDDLFAGKNTPGTYPAVLAALARIKEATDAGT